MLSRDSSALAPRPAAQIPGPALQMAQPSHAHRNTLGSLATQEQSSPLLLKGMICSPRHPHRSSQRTNYPPKGVKQNSAPHSTRIPEPHFTKPLFPALWSEGSRWSLHRAHTPRSTSETSSILHHHLCSSHHQQHDQNRPSSRGRR